MYPHTHTHTHSLSHTLTCTLTSVTTLPHAEVRVLVQTGLSPPERAAPAGKGPGPATRLPDVPPEEHSTREPPFSWHHVCQELPPVDGSLALEK